MSTLLKDLYSPAFYQSFSNIAGQFLPNFDRKKFTKAIFTKDWEQKELKDRMKHSSVVLHEFMPSAFAKAAPVVKNMAKAILQDKSIERSFAYMFLPDYIEKYGINHFDASVKAMEVVTELASCEYAVRPFLIKYGDKMFAQMLAWSTHKNHHVRRLASEGARPRLPWGMAVPGLKANPQPVLPILENLKTDSSEYVRRSVANNLNDIAKDHPKLVIALAKSWKGLGENTDAIVKHGCRTLLKQGNAEVLKHFKLADDPALTISHFELLTPKVKIGGHLELSFTVNNASRKPQTIRLEYAIYFLMKNGQFSKKVFKISEKEYAAGSSTAVLKKHSFRVITTRQYYTGLHKVGVILNGKEKATGEFMLDR
ncbi:MAG: DNA alkylation repair protein [Bacteroidia bacterium]|jgi:3-methyladenine DNA glycosylase AlkC|nr:DNA alkylation repair protein [Bacteroidia bacterium]